MRHPTRRIYYISNVFEESVKDQRRITTDSPAANRKVISLCQAVKRAGGDVEIISLGRGRVKGSWKSYPATTAHAGIVPITYLHFMDVPVVTHLCTMISLLVTVLIHTRRDSVFVFYNFSIHYLLALLYCHVTGKRCILDLEDGLRGDDTNVRSLPSAWLLKIHNICCRAGVMLAAMALKGQTSGQQTFVCYGVDDGKKVARDWSGWPLQIHLGGSLLEDTGAELFLETLKLLTVRNPQLFTKLRFIVTGFGPYADAIRLAAEGEMSSFLCFHGNATLSEYERVIQHSHIGLCLKLPESSMGATTFPSKVIELVSNGLLLVSTRVSDVPLIFDDGSAFLLDAATPEALAEIFERIALNPDKARDIAMNGRMMLLSKFSEAKVGKELLQFWLCGCLVSRAVSHGK